MNIATPAIERYCEQHTAPLQPLLERLVQCTRERMDLPHMQVGRIEGALLRMLCSSIGAKRVLELGTFTGFSALCMAEALPEDGEWCTART